MQSPGTVNLAGLDACMDVEFMSGVVVSYSKLLREMAGISKDVKEILQVVRTVLPLADPACNGNTFLRRLEGRCSGKPPGICSDSKEVSAALRKTLQRDMGKAMRKGPVGKSIVRRGSPGALSFFQEVEREVCAQWGGNVFY